MKRMLKRLAVPIATLFVLSWVMLSPTLSNAGPWSHHKTRGGGCTYSVAEPITLVMLGAGIASLVVYAKRKKGQK
jgi:hypothetical protein